MRHEVPQFIDIENKFFGYFSFTQGLYLIGGFLGSYALYVFIGKIVPNINWIIKVVLSSPFFVLGLLLAFVKINGLSFIKFLEAWFFYIISPKKYNWRKIKNEQETKIIKVDDVDQLIKNIDESLNKPVSGGISSVDYLMKKKQKRQKIKSLAVRLDMDLD